MEKKRRAWWIVGGVLGFFVLFLVAALLFERNSPDARLERVLNQIIAENGFEYTGENVSYERGSNDEMLSDIYEGVPIGDEQKRRILELLRDACPSCTVEVRTVGEDYLPVTQPTSEPTFDMYTWTPRDRSVISYVLIIFDDKDLDGVDDPPESRLHVARRGDAARWSFLKRLWPW